MPVFDGKPFWQSKIFWAQALAIVFAMGSKFDWWPTNLDQNDVLTTVMMLIGALTVALRFFSHKVIGVNQTAADAKATTVMANTVAAASDGGTNG